jgi:phosphopentomutase
MPRAVLMVLDSFGCGGAEDAGSYGDAGADTLGHIAEACAAGKADRVGLRSGPLSLPVMASLGLGLAGEASTGRMPPGLAIPGSPSGQWGYGVERSLGKDTPSGHWEIAGTPVPFAWGYFPETVPAFPPELMQELIVEAALPGTLANRHASGTQVIEDFGAEHMQTGKPICYTSVDSVLQIAAHEKHFGLERLYEVCRIARRLCDPLNIGRVIARPFVGERPGDFHRTPNRKDFAVPPPRGTLLERAAEAGRSVVTIGKIGDIFAHRFTGQEIKGAGNMDLFDKTLAALDTLPEGGFVFANYVDLDTDCGHRRDVAGYAAGLEAFDARLPELTARLAPGDLAILTADHGNDPTWRGTDHTREHVPILAFGPGVAPGRIGRRESFADIGETLADHLGLAEGPHGRSWLRDSKGGSR